MVGGGHNDAWYDNTTTITCDGTQQKMITTPTGTVTAAPSLDGRPVIGNRRTRRNPSSRLSTSLAGCWMRTNVTSCCSHSHGPFDRGGGLPRCELSLPSSLDALTTTCKRRAWPQGRAFGCKAKASHAPGSRSAPRWIDGPNKHFCALKCFFICCLADVPAHACCIVAETTSIALVMQGSEVVCDGVTVS